MLFGCFAVCNIYFVVEIEGCISFITFIFQCLLYDGKKKAGKHYKTTQIYDRNNCHHVSVPVHMIRCVQHLA